MNRKLACVLGGLLCSTWLTALNAGNAASVSGSAPSVRKSDAPVDADSAAAENAWRAQDFNQAAILYGRAAEKAAVQGNGKSPDYSMRQIGALLVQDALTPDINILLHVVSIFQNEMSHVSRENNPEQWAVMQFHLAQVLITISHREIGLASLEQALAITRTALRSLSRKQSPSAWAEGVRTEANALWFKGNKTGNPLFLQLALSSLESVQTEMKCERSPALWAVTELFRSTTLAHMAVFESRTDLLKEAEKSARVASNILKVFDSPPYQAAIWSAFGSIAMLQGEFETGTSAFRRAITDFQAVTAIYTQTHMPREWAETQSARVSSLLHIFWRNDDPVTIGQAQEALHAVAALFTPQKNPRSWAVSQIFQSYVLIEKGRLTADRKLLDQAIAIQHTVLSAVSPEAEPALWHYGQTSLARALYELAKLDRDSLTLNKAEQAVKLALDTKSDGMVQDVHGYEQQFLGRILLEKSRYEKGVDSLGQAITAEKASLVDFSGKKFSFDWISSQQVLATILSEMTARTGQARYARQAVALFDLCLKKTQQAWPEARRRALEEERLVAVQRVHAAL
ncbi:hypothetical protein [Acetobacter sp.]|jgi:tetratricopeptide (TPR) repeat protein|uniref:hypothetical protein n=1 Tax=Acetobacter sp. TaxID=440 RepID=UPI0025BA7D3D|nr:hypothetical protein [Acetobacter sp.]MCH4092516.1 hypothetical protein [Acetobacter sp.]MCI1299650.1 hypothetical protein [Acetobacter sp.]MCI1315470.1 hypothetical protein [Acetobacter sp.]